MSERVVKLTLAYDGTDFHGWARQRDPSIRTIEGELTTQLERILQEDVKLSVAGRTDAGVHARGQVASFRTGSAVHPDRLRKAVNTALAPEVVVVRASRAPDRFDARFSASSREYRYRIREADIPDPFTSRFVWDRRGHLTLAPMRVAARLLVGEHDFRSFCRYPGGDRTTVRRLIVLAVRRRAEILEVRAIADAFLHQMVRSLVGTLVATGEGKLDANDIHDVLAARDRSAAGGLAPPQGLTLERVVYRSMSGASGVASGSIRAAYPQM
jgi:tRNA pseudouridine38-40 synthase